MSNTFGNLFRLTSFGESHGPGVGGIVDGFPAGIDIDPDFIQHELDRRRPGQSRITTPRKEADQVELLSGVFEGKSTGCPIGFLVRNTNQHSTDYDNMRDLYRPSHADFTYMQKYGLRDHRGGGRSSARETISRCVGGALAKLALRQLGVEIYAYTSQVGGIALEQDYAAYDPSLIETNMVRCPDPSKAEGAQVVRLGGQYLRGYVWDCLFAGIHFSFSGYFCACGKSGLSFLHNGIAILLVRLPGAYLASALFPSTLFPMGLATAAGSLLSVIVCAIAFWLLSRNKKPAAAAS